MKSGYARVKANEIAYDVKELASMRDKDIIKLFDPDPSDDVNLEIKDIKVQSYYDILKNKVISNESISTVKNRYNELKSLITQVKSKKFKNVEFIYDENNGRLTTMKYESI